MNRFRSTIAATAVPAQPTMIKGAQRILPVGRSSPFAPRNLCLFQGATGDNTLGDAADDDWAAITSWRLVTNSTALPTTLCEFRP